jgi:soluble lytic murein transglycosylase-like protein
VAVSQTISMPMSYKVREGDTLSSIARALYGHASRWPALWYINRRQVRDPNALDAGVTLQLSAWHPRKDWLLSKALANIPTPPPPPAPAPVQAAPVQAVSDAQPVADPAPAEAPAQTVSTGGMGSFQSCVIQRESSGNPAAVNASSGAGGLYGFLPSTWAGLGHSGLPENASVAEQNQAFAQEYAQSGTSAWAAYDGC